MRLKKFLPSILILSLFSANLNVFAASIVYHPSYPIYQREQKAVIYFNERTNLETLIVSTTFKGSARDFGWVIPVPTSPAVDEAKDDVFVSLEDLTRPKYGTNPSPLYDIAGLAPSKVSDSIAVKVLETKNIDVYTVSILDPLDKNSLKKWLEQNGYTIPKSADFVMGEYINQRYFFVAAKINTEALGPFVEGQLRDGHINPLKITFRTSQITYPIKLTGAVGSSYYGNYPYKGYDPQLNEGTPSMEKRVTEPDKGIAMPPPNQPYYEPPYTNSSTIVLYVIAGNKKMIPGFNTEYAGSIKEDKLEKLSTLKNGDPWISVTGKKYLTKLTRSMTYSEMNNDLIVLDAEDNTPVGTGGIYLQKPLRLFGVIILPLFLEGLAIMYYIRRRK